MIRIHLHFILVFLHVLIYLLLFLISPLIIIIVACVSCVVQETSARLGEPGIDRKRGPNGIPIPIDSSHTLSE